MKKPLVYEVFTPASPARLTFVERANIQNRVYNALRTPGKQLVVFGQSGSGKTTLLINKIEQLFDKYITTRCMSYQTFDHLVLDAFDQLGPFYESKRERTDCSSMGARIQAEYFGIKSKIQASKSKDDGVHLDRVLRAQLTPQRLAHFLGEAGYCWVIEDFHKLGESEKIKLAQSMKIFVDMAETYNCLKIIAIGAKGTAREIVRLDSEMANRVAEIYVPLMQDDELKEILEKGSELLNFSFESSVSMDIVRYSTGLASICHQLALNCCSSLDINETVQNTAAFVDRATFKQAVKLYLEDGSDTIKEAFDKALRRKRPGRFDNGRLILKSLTSFDINEGATHNQLLKIIQQREDSYPREYLSKYLRILQTEERGALVQYDDKSGKYSFTNPFHRAYAMGLFEKGESDLLSQIVESAIGKNINIGSIATISGIGEFAELADASIDLSVRYAPDDLILILGLVQEMLGQPKEIEACMGFRSFTSMQRELHLLEAELQEPQPSNSTVRRSLGNLKHALQEPAGSRVVREWKKELDDLLQERLSDGGDV